VRNAGKLKAGYYPLPLAEAERIRQWLEFPLSATVALDPCVGEGTAFAIIAADQAILRAGSNSMLTALRRRWQYAGI